MSTAMPARGPRMASGNLSKMEATSAGGSVDAQRSGWDFFLSYTAADVAWAVWIAWELETAGYRVLVQAWDFVPGSHWITRMQQGTVGAERTLAIVSQAYLGSVYGQQEWEAAFRVDPSGFIRKLIPVRVEDCDRPGLLGGVVSFDLFDCSPEVARQRLLSKVAESVAGRAKPESAPDFPGQPPARVTQVRPWETPQSPPRFPGGAAGPWPHLFSSEHVPGMAELTATNHQYEVGTTSYQHSDSRPQPRMIIQSGEPEQRADNKRSFSVSRVSPSINWDINRAGRGNGENTKIFHAHRRTYWLLFSVLLLLLLVVAVIAATPDVSVPSRIAAACGGATVFFFIYASARMARSPVRLEIGANGVQLFARSRTTWLPWRIIDRIEVIRVQGTPHVVAWIPDPKIFPTFDTLGGGPRYVPALGAVAVCPVGVMRASAREIRQALNTYYDGRHKFTGTGL